MMRKRFVGVGMMLLATSIAGCGSDDDDASSTDEYCNMSFEIETVGEPEVDFETASEEEIVEASKAFASDKILPLANKLQAAAPDEIADDVKVGVAAATELAETGDFETAFGKPEVDEALDRLHAFDLKECGWQTVNVSGVDYAFEGVPQEVNPGKTSFEFKNNGQELHEMIIFRRNDGVTEPILELLELPQEQVETKVTFVAAAFGEPGSNEYGIADLQKGEYAMLCFIAVGTTSPETEGSGPPHFVEGMVTEFTVK